MTKPATPNNTDDKFFLDAAPGGVNDFGGDSEYSTFEDDDAIADRGDNFTPSDDVDDLDDDGMELDGELNGDNEDEGEIEDDDAAESEGADDDEADADSDDDYADDADEDGSEDDDTDEDDGADEDDDDSKPKRPIPKKVPRQRLNKEIERRKKAEARLRELEQGNPTQPTPPQSSDVKTQVDAEKFKKMQDAMLDGDTETAMGLFNEMQQSNVDSIMSAAEQRAEQRMAQREANRELQSAVGDVFASFPELDSTSDDYDEQLASDVVATRDFYIERRNISPGEALKRAAREVATDYGLEDRNVKKEPVATKKPATKARKPNVERKLKVASKERGKLGGNSAGNRDVIPDITKLTDEQFDRLDPRIKAKARGDFL